MRFLQKTLAVARREAGSAGTFRQMKRLVAALPTCPAAVRQPAARATVLAGAVVRAHARTLALTLALASAPANAQTAPSDRCGAPPADSIVEMPVPGRPFQALPSVDGCWLFVSVNPLPPAGPEAGPAAGRAATPAASPAGVALLSYRDGRLTLVRVLPMPQAPAGMALTRDGALLAVTHNSGTSLVDVAAWTAGRGEAVIGAIPDQADAGRVYAGIAPDDRTLFIADERARSITVVDLVQARIPGGARSSVIGTIPTGELPIALTFSADGRWLFSTSQRAPAALQWPVSCRRQGSFDPSEAPEQTEGAILVIDVARARTTPAQSVVHAVRAGCNPVRLVLSPRGDRAYVSARAENALLVFDTRQLLPGGDSATARVARVPVGTAPVGVVVAPSGQRVLVTNSNRFAGNADDRQSVTIIDATRVAEGAAAIIGQIPAGAFPREMRLMPDGRTLVLTNFNSQTVQLVDLTRFGIAR